MSTVLPRGNSDVALERRDHEAVRNATRNSSPASILADKPTYRDDLPWSRRSLSQKLHKAILHLTPAFFTITMGVGISSVLLYNLPYNGDWLRIIAIVLFVLNVVVFGLLLAGTIARSLTFRGLFMASVRHPVAGMFWGTASMGLTTIVNMIAYACAPAWGRHWAYLAISLYFLNVLIALIINIGMIFLIISRHTHTSESFGTTILLPIVTVVVVASTGGVVAHPMISYDPWLARACVIVAYIVWGTGAPIAFLIIGLWIYRSAKYGYPPPSAIVSVFLPLGPVGQSSFGVLILGRVMRDIVQGGTPIVPSLDLPTNLVLADSIYAGGLVFSLILWGLGLVWYIIAFSICLDYDLSHRTFFSRSSFALNYWGLTFPIGVFATGATELASQLDSGILRVIGTILSLQVVLHCAWVSWMTVWKVWDGSVFAAPEVLAMRDPGQGGHSLQTQRGDREPGAVDDSTAQANGA